VEFLRPDALPAPTKINILVHLLGINNDCVFNIPAQEPVTQCYSQLAVPGMEPWP